MHKPVSNTHSSFQSECVKKKRKKATFVLTWNRKKMKVNEQNKIISLSFIAHPASQSRFATRRKDEKKKQMFRL